MTGAHSSGLGSDAAGMNGSLRALSTSVGTEIVGSPGLLDARVQCHRIRAGRARAQCASRRWTRESGGPSPAPCA
ncbi:hypothetical protein G6F50_017665 [Rhizopus delemar]|uniref:Uncharacterized protein n=1 Tax=Rhizopus delemar TaxID=936053 RepID=A0A9P6XPD4_9FUNG|nr:hypothetical protein G6F50_017665 [Rhizopus delemar]